MLRYEALVFDEQGAEFARYHVHADSRAEAMEQAKLAFNVLFRDREIDRYSVKISTQSLTGRH